MSQQPTKMTQHNFITRQENEYRMQRCHDSQMITEREREGQRKKITQDQGRKKEKTRTEKDFNGRKKGEGRREKEDGGRNWKKELKDKRAGGKKKASTS